MSRSGYTDDGIDSAEDQWRQIRWRGAVKSAIRGKHGQAFLKELLAALDAMEDKRLYAGLLQREEGGYCALGVLGAKRGLDMSAIPHDVEDEWGGDEVAEAVADLFEVNDKVAREIMWENDEAISDHKYVQVRVYGPMPADPRAWGPARESSRFKQIRVYDETAPARRWRRMRAWAASQIKEASP
jgi:hypothetical protein